MVDINALFARRELLHFFIFQYHEYNRMLRVVASTRNSDVCVAKQRNDVIIINVS